jgi:hypothetical protein
MLSLQRIITWISEKSLSTACLQPLYDFFRYILIDSTMSMPGESSCQSMNINKATGEETDQKLIPYLKKIFLPFDPLETRFH